jgi:hypothetical protein
MKIRLSAVCFIAICLQWSAAVSAHHATALQYDISKTVKVKGVVAKLDWANPHAHLHLDVKDGRGNEEHWDVELGSPGAVVVSGLSRTALAPGSIVTVVGYPGKSIGSSEAPLCATQLTLADGRTAEFVVGI